MTPREKAQELLIQMQFQSQPLMFNQAKKCALIAVDEIIKSGLLLDSSVYVMVSTSIDFWQQVKQEIEQL